MLVPRESTAGKYTMYLWLNIESDNALFQKADFRHYHRIVFSAAISRPVSSPVPTVMRR